MMALLLVVTLALSTRALPKDTANVDGKKIVGVAVPTQGVIVPGDLNFDGKRSTADIMILIGNVLLAKPLPTANGDSTLFQIKKDTTMYLFVPTNGVAR